MKIALATWFPKDPKQPRGGVESVSVNLARALAEIPGTEVHVVTFDSEIDVPVSHCWADVTIHRLPRTRGSLLEFSKGLGRRTLQACLLNIKPDIVHSHDTFGIMTVGLGLPRVFTIHGFIHEDTRIKGGWRNRVRAGLWKREELAAWAEQPHIVSISPYVRERLRGITEGTIYDIENPIDAEFFDIPRDETTGGIFSAAVICRRKNQLALVEAIADLAPKTALELRLAGPVVEPDYGRELDCDIRARSLGDHVRFLGNLSGSAVRKELSKASIYVLASIEEGAPMGISEAMAAGVPVVASNRCGMPYMIRHGETGFLVNPQRPAEIAIRIGELLTDDPLRARMGRDARAAALDRHHPSRVAQRTHRLYKEIIETSKS